MTSYLLKSGNVYFCHCNCTVPEFAVADSNTIVPGAIVDTSIVLVVLYLSLSVAVIVIMCLPLDNEAVSNFMLLFASGCVFNNSPSRLLDKITSKSLGWESLSVTLNEKTIFSFNVKLAGLLGSINSISGVKPVVTPFSI